MTTPAQSPSRARAAPAPAPMRAWRSLLETHKRLLERLAAELEAETGLPLEWYDVLVQLSEARGERLRMQDLAARLLTSRSNCTRLVDRMEQAGLVTRARTAEDRRGVQACLTAEGRAALRAAAPAHLRGIQVHFAQHLSDGEASTMAEALDRIGAELTSG